MAYVAVTCLMRTIQQSMEVTRCNFQSFYKKLESLRTIMEKPTGDDEALTSLEAEIIELVYHTEDMEDSESRNYKNLISRIGAFPKLQQAVGCIDSRVNNTTSQHVGELQSIMVGHENEMMQDQLARGSTELEVVSIVGMGGIDKITLANKIYNDSFIMSHFDIRAKATVSQVYCAKNVVLSLLTSTSGKTDEFHEHQDDRQLADRLQKCLKGRRYLVVIDDICVGTASNFTRTPH
ncbi:hypothetical protein CQW23_06316 [Capsicum baccatum]|uniref:NB-ARC domain-containing protein n=1 Tax=Capsicum baccatum TaxID=33114 RepID=A0A2G2X2Y4_CAPBA|nr:hypothetical protein CQW23_06316 [Capsicum baccatum]